MVKYVEVAQTIMDEVKKAVIGKDECVKKILAAILAGGHILIEDILPILYLSYHVLAFYSIAQMRKNRVCEETYPVFYLPIFL